MSLFNTPDNQFDEIEINSLLCTSDTNQLTFGQSSGESILNVGTVNNRTININDTSVDIDLVYCDSGSSNITDFTIDNAVNFTGTVTGTDITGTMNSLVVNSVGNKTTAQVQKSVDDTLAANYIGTVNEIVKLDMNGDFIANEITASLNGHADSSTSFTGSLAGDVSGTQSVTSVDFINGKTALEVSDTIDDVNSASSQSGNPSKLIRRNSTEGFFCGDILPSSAGSGNFDLGSLSSKWYKFFSTNISDDSISCVINNGTFNGTLVGNSDTATTSTNFTGNLTGDVSGTQGATVVDSVGGKSASDLRCS
eukprot:Lithocolla_globosa_v1_NODE_20_length_9637_cov_33.687643.p2 type:complete len:309 gc:universal NODE_20_length_9637_cov_33.687643:6530-5604(-)